MTCPITLIARLKLPSISILSVCSLQHAIDPRVQNTSVSLSAVNIQNKTLFSHYRVHRDGRQRVQRVNSLYAVAGGGYRSSFIHKPLPSPSHMAGS